MVARNVEDEMAKAIRDGDLKTVLSLRPELGREIRVPDEWKLLAAIAFLRRDKETQKWIEDYQDIILNQEEAKAIVERFSVELVHA
jgi:tRNA G37 N-methylase Trm5